MFVFVTDGTNGDFKRESFFRCPSNGLNCVFLFSMSIEYQLHAKQFTWAPGACRKESHLDLALRLLHFNRGDRATKTKSPDSKYKVVGAVRVRERNLEHIRLLRDVALKLNLNR